MQRNIIAKYLLLATFIFVFGLFGVDKMLNPAIWIGWIPPWMDGLLNIQDDLWLIFIGIAEMFFAAMLLIPHRRTQQIGTVLIALHLAFVLTQVGWNDIGVRDIGLLGGSLALLTLL